MRCINLISYCGIYLAIMVTFIGCGKEPVPPPSLPDSGPVSLEVWKTLPIELKYDEAVLARVREHDPKLKSKEAWKIFQQEIIKPEFDRDVPKVSPEEARK